MKKRTNSCMKEGSILKRLMPLMLTAVMVVSGLTACAGNKPNSTNNASTTAPTTDTKTSSYTFTDDCKRKVEVPNKIDKIVSSGPLAQIILFAIAPEKFVGLSAKWSKGAEEIVAEKYRKLPYFGQLYGSANLNVEELAKAGPQIIIDVGEAKRSIVKDMDTLQDQTKIPAVHIDATLETVPQAFRTLGKLLKKEERAEKLAQFCEKTYARTTSIMKSVGDKKVNALYVLGEKGLHVLAKDSFHAQVIDLLTNNLAVVDNPAGKGTGNETTIEQIAAWNPDFVIFAPDSIYDGIDKRDTWKDIAAIKNKKYVKTPNKPHNWVGSPPSVQRYLGLIWLTAVLYPEHSNYDVKAEVTEYYKLFYDCTLTDKQYTDITTHAFL